MPSHADPLVSVIVPAYNVARYVDDCLASIRRQTYRHLEIIVVEDGSTDGSADIIAKHLPESRIVFIRHPQNRGLSAARNTGIDASRGDYLMFVDADDLIAPRLVEWCVQCARDTSCDVVAFGFTRFGKGDATEPHDLDDSTPRPVRAMTDLEYFDSTPAAWCKFIRAGVVKSGNLRFPVGLYCEDHFFHYHLGFLASSKVELQDDVYRYRQRHDSITGLKGKEYLDYFAVQKAIIDLIVARGTDQVRAHFATRSYAGAGAILLGIQREHVRPALELWKAFDQDMRSHGLRSDSSLRCVVMTSALRMPMPLAFLALTALRSRWVHSISRLVRLASVRPKPRGSRPATSHSDGHDNPEASHPPACSRRSEDRIGRPS